MPADQSPRDNPRPDKASVVTHRSPTNFRPRWRRISTRQLTKALSKARQELMRRLAAPPLRRSAPIQYDANRCNPSCPLYTALPKARRVLMLHRAAHQLQATLAADLHTPADRGTVQGNASARAAPQHINFNAQRSAPIRCDATTLQPVLPEEQSIAQGKAGARAASRRTFTSNCTGGGSPHAS